MRGRAGAPSIVHQTFDGLVWSPSSCRLFRAPSPPNRRPRSFEPGRLPGFVALVATSPKRVHDELGIPTPCSVPSTGDRSLSTVYSALRLRGLFHPRAASRALCPLRGFSLHAARAARRRPTAPLPSAPPPSRGSRDPRCQARAPRLRGFAPRGAAFRRRHGVTRASRRSPLRVRAPPGPPALGPAPAYPGRSARDVTRSGLRLRARRSTPSPASWHPRGGTASVTRHDPPARVFEPADSKPSKTCHPTKPNFRRLPARSSFNQTAISWAFSLP